MFLKKAEIYYEIVLYFRLSQLLEISLDIIYAVEKTDERERRKKTFREKACSQG